MVKSWQDRGEVQDSDDEELSIGGDSQIPEQSRKRAKLAHEHASLDESFQEQDVQLGDGRDDDEVAWLAAKPAKPYGLRSGDVHGDSGDDEIARESAAIEADDLLPPPADAPDPVNKSGSTDDGVREGLGNVRSQTSESGNLPELADLFWNRATVDARTSQFAVGGLASNASSPLSSPPNTPPAVFRLPSALSVSHASHHYGSGPSILSSGQLSGSISDHDANAEEPSNEQLEAIANEPARRELRTRRQVQLHPYQVDRVQYQKQFRERGLRTFRLAETDEAIAAETHNISQSDDEDETTSQSQRSIPAGPSSELGEDSFKRETAPPAALVPAPGSDDELPDVTAIFSRHLPGGLQYGNKRRKLAHTHKRRELAAVDVPRPTDHAGIPQTDDFSIPPSPPPTSSDFNRALTGVPGIAGFRIPRGLSPASLPTPDVSSEGRPNQHRQIDGLSDAESPGRRSRTSPILCRPSRAQVVESSTELETESEPDSAMDDHRLQHERKRIKGVLPASWLKIDLQSRQHRNLPSPTQRRRLSTTSPPPTGPPQKGVAQRVASRNSTTPACQHALVISDDDDENSSDSGAESDAPYLRQTNLHFPERRKTVARTETVDDDRMEVDWIDPMFAGTSGNRTGTVTKPLKKRQPRITDALQQIRESRADFSEERAGLNHHTVAQRAPGRKHKASGLSVKTPYRLPKRSIIDAPSSPPDVSTTSVPQFVRLATRQARKRPDGGRHSPNRKTIRLATSGDTADAASTLKAWRDGSIARRADSHSHQRRGAARKPAFDNDLAADLVLQRRPPLAGLSHNQQRDQCPSLLRKQVNNRVRQPSGTVSLPKARLQQSRLRPVVLSQDHPSSSGEERPGRVPDAVMKRIRPARRPLPSTARLRSAQLETLEGKVENGSRSAVFERRMQCLIETITIRHLRQPTPGLKMSRFMQDEAAVGGTWAVAPSVDESQAACGNDEVHLRSKVTLQHRSRKRQPQRVDAEARKYRQPSEPLPEVVAAVSHISRAPASTQGPSLQGLGPFATRYPIDFDIRPLQLGTYFHESTFVGSGDFTRSLSLNNRDLDVSAGRIRIYVDGEPLEWSSWTEDVATGMARIPQAIRAAFHTLSDSTDSAERQEQIALVASNVDHMLRSIIRYCSNCLSFLDPIDRRYCTQRLLQLIADLSEVLSELQNEDRNTSFLQTQCQGYLLILARQSMLVADHPLVVPELRVQCRNAVNIAASKLAGVFVATGLTALRDFYEDNRLASKRETGIKQDAQAVSSIVILHHTLQELHDTNTSMWPILSAHLSTHVQQTSNIHMLDQTWYDIMTVLPALEIDSAGIGQVGSRFSEYDDGWSIVKRLLGRVFELYPTTVSTRTSTLNDYIRATLHRCYHLSYRWGWWRCEPVLGSIYDFFARRGLALLDNEEARGSPRFLQELDEQPSLEVLPEDRSFAIFLKMLVAGLQSMRKRSAYNDRKIGGIAWRFIPNHGRTYRKDAEVRRTDLDALRNHHDLLCTLYYGSPQGHRLRLDVLRNLVDHSTSHREACRLSVRAWCNLASFQASTGESVDNLEPFTLWYRDMMTITVAQFRLARSEAEQEFSIAKAQGVDGVTEELLERTIASNERQVVATLIDLLAAVKRAVQASSSLATVVYLVRETAFWGVFTLFDPSQRRLHTVLEEGVAAVKVSLQAQDRFQVQVESQRCSEDSQEFGDSSALQEFATTQNAALPNSDYNLAALLQEPIGHLLSNVLGADQPSDDDLVSKLVDVWIQLAKQLVRSGTRSWVSFIDGYEAFAWSQMRDTELRRRFTPYFQAHLLESADSDVTEVRQAMLSAWLKSLVEREAMLKFQHTLTTNLLNQCGSERLLNNLPYTKRARADWYDISLQELRQRRLALLSSVLSNMGQSFHDALYERPSEVQELRRAYADMLRHLMQAMRNNYQELRASNIATVADPSTHGAYVEFVQHVVSYLQQYTADICPVDRFFTDSTAFPLPVTDPAYVVGRVRSYIPKLADSKARKQLVVFIQTVSERAAVDEQQVYLVEQLTTAIVGTLERGNPRAPTLRHVLLSSVFPAHIAGSLLTATSWILALPILQVVANVVRELLYDIKFEDHSSVSASVECLEAVFRSGLGPVMQGLAHPGLLQLPHVQKILTAVFETMLSSVTICFHLSQVGSGARPLLHHLNELHEQALLIQGFLRGEVLSDLQCHYQRAQASSQWPDTAAFASQQVRDAAENWYAQDGQYFLRRGNVSKEIVVMLDEGDAERERLYGAINSFCTAHGHVLDQSNSDSMRSRDYSIAGLLV